MDGIYGVILAGGLARRMGGGDKPLRTVGGRTMLTRVIERLRPQCDGLVLNANGDPARFADTGLPVAADTVPDRAGPLAGVLAGLDWLAANTPRTEWAVTVGGDTPFLPPDLVARLASGRREAGAAVAMATSADRVHWTTALWPVALRPALRSFLVDESLRRAADFAERHATAQVCWPVGRVDPFFNVNTPQDAMEAERMAALLDPPAS